MFLSCYILDLRYPEVRRALRNAYEMHRTVMSAFRFIDSKVPRQDMGVLFRLITTGRVCKLYVSSAEKPLSDMPQGFVKQEGSPKEITDIAKSFSEGRVLHFNLMAMPSKKVKVLDCKNSKRVFLGKEADREKWLMDKAMQNGFQVVSFFEQKGADNRIKNGGYQSVVFQGLLRIIDQEKFRNAYQNGIGAEKAFGCGMLLLSNPS